MHRTIAIKIQKRWFLENVCNLILISLVILFLLIAGAGQAGAFVDDFNRTDGPIGNGWSNTSDNAAGDLELLNGEVTSTSAFGAAGIYRSFSFTDPLNIQATLRDTVDSNGARNRYESYFSILNNGARRSGYGISVTKSSSRFANARVSLIEGDGAGFTTIDFMTSTFQYGTELDVDFSIFLDGSVVGSITEGANVFDFSFGAYSIQSSGDNFAYSHTFRGHSSSSYPDPSMDNLNITTVPEPISSILFLIGGVTLGFRKFRKTIAR